MTLLERVGCCPKPDSFALMDDAIVCSYPRTEAVGLLGARAFIGSLRRVGAARKPDAVSRAHLTYSPVGLLPVLPTFTLLSDHTPAMCERQALDGVGNAIRHVGFGYCYVYRF